MPDVEKVTRSYPDVIREARKTVLGFFSLASLILQLIIVALIVFIPTSELLIVGAIGSFTLLFLIIAGIFFVKPQVFGVDPLPDDFPAKLGEDIVGGFDGTLSNGTRTERDEAYNHFYALLDKNMKSKNRHKREFVSKLRESVEERAEIERRYTPPLGVIDSGRSGRGDD